MTISIWRYSHLALAVSSFVFIVLAAVTGIILAFEPISEKTRPYKVGDLDSITIAQTIRTFKNKYPEVIEMEVDANNFFSASVFTEDGDNLNGYFDPESGVFLGEKPERPRLFQFVTTLHRSLFLKGVGRFFVGLCSFLLFLIAVSGAILIVKRQRGFKQFFSKIINENFSQYYHIVTGRISLIPIVIITLTGTYLSLEKFRLIPEHKNLQHEIDYGNIAGTPPLNFHEFPFFNSTPLSVIKHIEFPFSTDVEDFYTIKTRKSELKINQLTGGIESEMPYPFTNFLSSLSLSLHTGKGSIAWSLILALASLNILFFVYSGFKMTLVRRKSSIKNKYRKDECEYVILVGSENGSTLGFANLFYNSLLKAGQKVYIDELNTVSPYKKLKHLIVFTATYGKGDAPANASRFLKIAQQELKQPFSYSAVGFGSLSYPDFCKFATDVDKHLETFGFRSVPLYKINDKSFASFLEWASVWSSKMNVPIQLPKEQDVLKAKKTKSFEVTYKTSVHKNPDATFMIELRPKGMQRINSGDLLAIYPKNDHTERLYSIGKKGKAIRLSVKHHQKGVGSDYLNNLSPNDILKARVIKNIKFHFPKKAPRVILIANGTGIAPFLGMLEENKKKVPANLYLGLRTEASFELYQHQINHYLKSGKLTNIHLALSREKENLYVQDLLERDAAFIANALENRSVVMICGSLNMQNDVLKTLDTICKDRLDKPLEFYRERQQLKMDCY